jgi:hypothetical protein
MNKVISRDLDSNDASLYPCKVLNMFVCPFDKKSNNYTMDDDNMLL